VAGGDLFFAGMCRLLLLIKNAVHFFYNSKACAATLLKGKLKMKSITFIKMIRVEKIFLTSLFFILIYIFPKIITIFILF